MAPAKKWIQTARQDIRNQARILNRARTSSYNTTSQALAGVYGSLGTTVSGQAANLTTEQTRQMAALQKLRSNTNQNVGAARRGAQHSVQNLYGSAVAGGLVPTGFSQGKATQKAGRTALAAQVGAAGIVARGNTAAEQAIQAGVGGAQAGASALAADALMYRAKNDASLIAQQQADLNKMVLQNKLDLQNYKAKLQMADQANGGSGSMSAVAQTAASATTGLFQNFRQWVAADGTPVPWDQATQDDNGQWVDQDGNPLRPMSPAGAATQYMADNGIDPASNEGTVIMSIARAMASGGAGTQPGAYNSAGLVDAVNQQMAILYPQFAKHQSTIDGIIAATFAQDNAGPTPGNGPPNGPVAGSDFWHPSATANVVEGVAGGAALGAALGSVIPGAGTLAGGALGGAIGGISGLAQNLSGSMPNTAQIAQAQAIVQKVKDGKMTEAAARTALKKLGFS